MGVVFEQFFGIGSDRQSHVELFDDVRAVRPFDPVEKRGGRSVPVSIRFLAVDLERFFRLKLEVADIIGDPFADPEIVTPFDSG